MLTLAEVDLARRDVALPGLAMVLDPEAFLEALRAVVRLPLNMARVAYVKYRPEKYCRASYRVVVDGAECDLDVQACRPEDVDSWRRAENGEIASTRLGFGRLVLADRSVLVTAFPNDTKLKQVSRLTDPEERPTLLREVLPGRPECWQGELRGLRYWPGRRYSAELRAIDGSRVLLKAYTRRGYHRARRNAEAFRSRGPLRVARLLGYSNTHRLLAFEWLPGRMLSECNEAPGVDWRAIVDTGAALAELHTQPTDGLESWTRNDEKTYFFSLAREIEFLRPGLADRARALAYRLAAWLDGAPPVQLPVHGDFSDAQVLVDGREASIVDLDSACRGDPADDLGSLAAQWEIHALTGKLSRSHAETMEDALMNGYRRSSIRSPMERLAPYKASGLLRRVRFAFRARRADWPEITEAALARAEAIMDPRS